MQAEDGCKIPRYSAAPGGQPCPTVKRDDNFAQMQQFQALFCEQFGCLPSEYEERAFRHCLYAHARFLAPSLRGLNPDFFSQDFAFIRYLGEATGMREARAQAADFQDANRAKPSFLRTGLRIRVSGRKAGRLAQRLFVRGR